MLFISINNVCQDTTSSDLGACARAFDNQGGMVVSFGGDGNDIVATRKVIERMVLANCLQPNFSFLPTESGDVAEHLMAFAGLDFFLLKIVIQFFEFNKKCGNHCRRR